MLRIQFSYRFMQEPHPHVIVMSRMKRIKRACTIYLINTFLSGTHFYSIKRSLLNSIGIPCGKDTRVVGPMFLGNVSQVSFGDGVWVGREFKVYGNGSVSIGNNIDIAPDVAFVTGSHEIGDSRRRAGEGLSYQIAVRDGCWIGARSTILGNTTVREGCVIAAGAMVHRSTDADSLYGGVPAKLIRRLDQQENK